MRENPNNIIIDGKAYLNRNEIPFHFENHVLCLFFEFFVKPKDINAEDNETLNKLEEVENKEQDLKRFICVRKFGMLSGGYYLMHTEQPVSVIGCTPFPHVYNCNIDWYIEDYCIDVKYYEMRFHFDELKYFIPSSSMAKYTDDDRMIFDKSLNIKADYEIIINDTTTKVQLVNYSNDEYRPFSEATAKTISEIRITFEKTDDYYFIYRIYQIIEDIFSFICNRRNLSLNGAKLLGFCGDHGEHPVESFLHVYSKYKEPIEPIKIISQTVSFELFYSSFNSLLQLVADNYNNESGTLSVKGIHPSILRRNLIDLRQSINITSAFEHHVRTFMPEISSDETLQTYEEIKQLIADKYVSSVQGKKKKIAKDIVKNLNPMISLEDKIRKCIKGYKNWNSLEEIVSERFYDWDKLASIVNEWRNELAHEKREASPTYDTIRSVRLVEHLNYSIVLRVAGYSNSEIKQIIEAVLIV